MYYLFMTELYLSTDPGKMTRYTKSFMQVLGERDKKYSYEWALISMTLSNMGFHQLVCVR